MNRKKIIFNPENPKGLEVDFTEQENLQAEKDLANSKKDEQDYINFINKEQANKKSSYEKFLSMGLTQDEASTITGYKPPDEEADTIVI